MGTKKWFDSCLVAFAILLSVSVSAGAQEEGGSMVGTRAPQFSVADVSGNTFALDSLISQHDAVVLNFWGLRCQACIEEIPHLNELSRKFGKRILILGVNVDALDAGALEQHRGKIGVVMEYPVIPDPDFTLVDMYRLVAAPLTIVIDGSGNVRYWHENYEPGDEKKLEETIGSILDGKVVSK